MTQPPEPGDSPATGCDRDLVSGGRVPEIIRPSSSQRKALGVFAFVATFSLIVLSLPVASGLFLGTLMSFALLRVYEPLVQRLKRPGLASMLLAVGSATVLLSGLTAFFYFVIDRGIIAANSVARDLQPGGPLRAWFTRLDAATQSTPIGPIDLTGRVQEVAATAASKLTGWAAALAALTFDAALMLFFAIMTTYFVLRHWTSITLRAERMLPLHPAHTRIVLAEFQRVGGEVFIGTLLTSITQGMLAGLGYGIVSMPEAALLGALTAICSLVPAIGTLLVWVPVGLGLAIAGRVGAGVFVLIWGALVVGVVCDYVIRPKLVGRTSHVPTLVTFISLFGGVQVFGLLGLIVGPVIASVAIALLETYDKEKTREQLG